MSFCSQEVKLGHGLLLEALPGGGGGALAIERGRENLDKPRMYNGMLRHSFLRVGEDISLLHILLHKDLAEPIELDNLNQTN